MLSNVLRNARARNKGCGRLLLSSTRSLSTDTHCTIVPYFSVPDDKMDEFTSGFSNFYKHTREGTLASGECLYYGFAVEGNKVFCREGYKSAEGVLAHLGEVEEELGVACGIVGESGLDLSVMGPAAELEKLKGPMGPLGTKFFTLDEGPKINALPH